MNDSTFPFVGGDLSLDLVNTLTHQFDPVGPYEMLETPEDLLDWYGANNLIQAAERKLLGPKRKALLTSAHTLRSHLSSIYRGLIRKGHGTQTDRQINKQIDEALTGLNASLELGRDRVTLRREHDLFQREVQLEIRGPIDPAVRVAHLAARRLEHLELHRLKECANPECDLIFYDETRNGLRRWCDMTTCGNRLKQARHRATGKSETATASRRR
jgi:predicted RNA-binding Zn ribbon-like protein